MSALLWTLAVVGAWNLANMVLRIYFRAPWWPYLFSVLMGTWAAVLLVVGS